CDELARRGLVVARVEYRTRGRDGVLPGEDIADAVDAMRWVRRHAGRIGIDPTRVLAAGGSSGAYLAASLFAFEERFPDAASPAVSARPDGIILNSPLVDWLEVGSMTDAFLFVLNGDKELGARISPARHWRRDCPPTLVLLGSEEPQVAGVRAFAHKWKEAGAPVSLCEAAGGEHGFFWKPDWIERTLAHTDGFLQANGFLAARPTGAAAQRTPAAAAPTDSQASTAGRLAAMLARFPEADANKDGVLTMDEAATFRAKKQPARKAAK
ncbi:MAG: alpha/beta hydrolase, partial [Verrucomicrobia bacterium]|nr:alpha/beta hydrolase [Verrucomicrobiota bacterium]